MRRRQMRRLAAMPRSLGGVGRVVAGGGGRREKGVYGGGGWRRIPDEDAMDGL